MNPIRDCTLVFLIKRTDGEVSDICLAMKKRGFGAGKWNGAGGKVEKGESIEAAAKREVIEEIGVEPHELVKVGKLMFNFSHNPSWDMLVHAYLCESWSGNVSESDEMQPKWFDRAEIPFASMWPDDEFWLPSVLDGKKIKARFAFGESDIIEAQDVRTVKKI